MQSPFSWDPTSALRGKPAANTRLIHPFVQLFCAKAIRLSSCMTHTTRERLCVRMPRHKAQRQKPQAGHHSPASKHSLQSSCLRRGTPNHLPKPHIMAQRRYSPDFPHCKANSVICTDNHEIELANGKAERNYKGFSWCKKFKQAQRKHPMNSHCIALRSKTWAELQIAWHYYWLKILLLVFTK